MPPPPTWHSMQNRSSLALSFLLVIAIPATTKAQVPNAATELRYDRDIRPILADRCFKCHGPDPAARRGKFRLDDYAFATEQHKNGAPIVPGNPAASLLLERVASDDPDKMMPPPDSGKRHLQPSEREIIAQWIASGAKYEPHWSFVLPIRADLPAVQTTNFTRNPIDRFVLAQLERRKLQPNAEADRASLGRRAFLTVTGLPPTPEELNSFTADPSPTAYEALVDKLLDTEPYRSRHAERMAIPWLDAARYADTSGIHMDAGRQMWKYRDWVIEAYRDNLPFDQFVLDQLAGDLMPAPSQAQQIASGFHRCHVTTDEGGAIDEEYLVEYSVDRVATTGSVFLGLTLGCARCHDHKYDPVSQEDFYRLYAYFNSIEEPGLYSQIADANRALEPFFLVPSVEQQQQQTKLQQDLLDARALLATKSPEEDQQISEFQNSVLDRAQLNWVVTQTLSAKSSAGATMTVEADGSVRITGNNPATDTHTIQLHTNAQNLRMVHLHAIADVHPDGRVGRAANGNAVLQAIEVDIASVLDPQQHEHLPLAWAWGDVEQTDSDFRATNVLAADDKLGWAVNGHGKTGPRNALILAEHEFGYQGGTTITVTLRYDSIYENHVFGHVQLGVSSISEQGLAMLPESRSGYFVTSPFAAEGEADLYAHACGPETATEIDLLMLFGDAKKPAWHYQPKFHEGVVNNTPSGRNIVYVAQRVFAPSQRELEISLGSDDGFQLFLDAKEVAQHKIDRAVAPDQDLARLSFSAGRHLVTMKVVNNNGQGGFYQRYTAGKDELSNGLVGLLLPKAAGATNAEMIREEWRLSFSKGYAEKKLRIKTLEQEVTMLELAIPKTMVMKERKELRPTFVLKRGAYDKPDKSRPVRRGIPAALGKLTADSEDNRLGLAKWLTNSDNPLFARVQVNRLFEQVFGQGLVRTTEDFGMQGEWPSHPELLDWLAIEFREQGFNVRHMLKLMLKSAAFRQDSRTPDAARLFDPDNRLLSWFPRRRLTAEQLRDQALYVADFLVEQLGGPSVKPYQPEGLWQEVAMQSSNTRAYQRGSGNDLFRRSLYTYWKRASPPPTMLTFDAPTREFCTVRRAQTNTPLQALVLWNDEQFVEAARGLAVRTMQSATTDDARLDSLWLRCTGKAPSISIRERARQTLLGFRQRYTKDPSAAQALLAVGTRTSPTDLPPAELAAWTMLANAALNLDSTVCNP